MAKVKSNRSEVKGRGGGDVGSPFRTILIAGEDTPRWITTPYLSSCFMLARGDVNGLAFHFVCPFGQVRAFERARTPSSANAEALLGLFRDQAKQAKLLRNVERMTHCGLPDHFDPVRRRALAAK